MPKEIEILKQCRVCKVLKVKKEDGRTSYKPSVCKLPKVPQGICYACKNKQHNVNK